MSRALRASQRRTFRPERKLRLLYLLLLQRLLICPLLLSVLREAQSSRDESAEGGAVCRLRLAFLQQEDGEDRRHVRQIDY